MPDVRMPDGTIIRNVPEGTTRAQLQEKLARSRKPTSFWQGVAEGIVPAADNAGRLMEATPPLDLALRGAGFMQDVAQGRSPTFDRRSPRAAIKREVDKAFARSPNRGSTAGKIVGGIIGTLPTAALPGGPLVQGAAAGGLLNEDGTPLGIFRDMATGLVGGYLGDKFGRYVVAPAARKVVKVVAPKRVPSVTKMDKTVRRVGPDIAAVRKNLDDAVKVGLPYSLADASPELRALGGSVSRKSLSARELAERNFGPRAKGQADRAVNAIDTMLAPVTDIEARSGAIKLAAQQASAPFYDAARSAPVQIDDEMRAMLATPAGKAAMTEAQKIAANQGIDLGDPETSMAALQLIKRGFDATLAPFRNPINNKLVLEGNPGAQAIADLAGRFNTKLGALSEDYAKGNAAYAAEIARRDALRLGQKVAGGGVPQRQFDTALGRMTDDTLHEMQMGYATAMADTTNRARLSGNPYSAIYGSPDQQAKVARLFPAGAPQFGRLTSLEDDMAKTAYETIGGSPTQSRAMADQIFDNGDPMAISGMIANPKMGLARIGLQRVRDQMVTRGEARAAEMAPTLFDMNPAAARDYIDQMAQREAAERLSKELYRALYGRTLALPAAAVAPLAVGGP